MYLENHVNKNKMKKKGKINKRLKECHSLLLFLTVISPFQSQRLKEKKQTNKKKKYPCV